jgi:hypothetical protein
MVDKYGLYVETNGDGGDCPNRTGIMIAYGALTNSINPRNIIDSVEHNLTTAPNVYFRYPIQWNQPSDFSRDQASRLMLGFGIAGQKDLVKGYYKLLLKNGLKHPNGDYIGIGEFNNLIRTFNCWYLYPLLVLLDVKFLGDMIARHQNPWGYDALICEDLYWTKKKLWTPTGWIARMFYKTTDAKQQIYDNLIDPETNGCIEAGDALQDIFSKM